MRKPIGWIAAIVTALTATLAGTASAHEGYAPAETRVAPQAVERPFEDGRFDARDRARDAERVAGYGRYERMRLERQREARLRRIEELRLARLRTRAYRAW